MPPKRKISAERKPFNWKNKKVLVTGASGFVGSHLTESLAEAGAKVRLLVEYSSHETFGWVDTFSDACIQSLDIVQGDLRDAATTLRLTRDIDYVFHLGAIISIPYSFANPYDVVSVNVMGTVNILDACRSSSVKRLIHISTSEVYGSAQSLLMDETHPLVAQSPYAASKIGADKIVESYHHSYDLPVVTIRPFNMYGPRQSARAIIPSIISQLFAGSRLGIGTLSTRRDFTFVQDAVEGMLRAASAPDVLGKTIHLGSGKETSVSELVEIIASILGCTPTLIQEPRRMRPVKSEVSRLCADTRVAEKLLGWNPSIDLKPGLEKTIEWMRAHKQFYERSKHDCVI